MIEFVLDCSISISWCLVDEDDDYANSILALMPDATAFVPEIWSLEVVNTLLVAERRNRITIQQTEKAINLLESLSILIDSLTSSQAFQQILTLGRSQGLASYDAAYLELALRKGLPLATNDNRLIEAAKRCQVRLMEV
ncbi:type II toxin-antitoxin system VapC family toxin [Crocosphaera sp. XPORK-15E]|uniref:type II toxin-antitoxin system VapC family toxin n=1 Tax=Crocosphaera sp. XPORK-15E TaxID=3110247 RepID=UPI002B1FD18C|nr:type II toxin-antitoxin system VapC family toxin [Crocosphaera sp. XPORK-15E]MEA5535524.1 type II toxin-antitoxin system VapC family toxin [Crocosphaera sp. XPORK-15E]